MDHHDENYKRGHYDSLLNNIMTNDLMMVKYVPRRNFNR